MEMERLVFESLMLFFMNNLIRLGIVCDQFGNLQRGGAEAQVENTVAALRKTGIVSVEYITHETNDISRFDLIHFFKSSFEYTPVAIALKERDIPYVVSTIIYPKHFRLEVCAYRMTRFLPRKVKSLLSISRRVQLWDNAAGLFPNTVDEAKFISDVSRNNFIKVIPNGLELSEMIDVSADLFFNEFPFLKGERFVLNVARIERRKNQKLLVQACKELDMPVVIVGKVWDQQYYEDIVGIGYEKCYFLGAIYNRNLLFSGYRACAVFALPSTLETPGIAAMEAAYYNAPIVITKNGGTDFYFKDKAYYVNWENKEEIKLGIVEMMNKIVDTKGDISEYSWDNIANMYLKVYKAICCK